MSYICREFCICLITLIVIFIITTLSVGTYNIIKRYIDHINYGKYTVSCHTIIWNAVDYPEITNAGMHISRNGSPLYVISDHTSCSFVRN